MEEKYFYKVSHRSKIVEQVNARSTIQNVKTKFSTFNMHDDSRCAYFFSLE